VRISTRLAVGATKDISSTCLPSFLLSLLIFAPGSGPGVFCLCLVLVVRFVVVGGMLALAEKFRNEGCFVVDFARLFVRMQSDTREFVVSSNDVGRDCYF
jgi:hypothetical protein